MVAPRGGMHGEGGACMAKGGMHGEGGKGAYVAKGCAWQKEGVHGERGGMHGKGGVHGMHPLSLRYGQSLRGRYASYWNAFFFYCRLLLFFECNCHK